MVTNVATYGLPGVGQRRRPGWYPGRPEVAYRTGMGDGEDAPTRWAAYLKQQTSRPGWSVARLAREAGFHRSTVFGWIAGDDNVNVGSVLAIANALGDDPANALLAAGDVEPPSVDEGEHRIKALGLPKHLEDRALARFRMRMEEARQRLLEDIQDSLEWGAERRDAS
jgi:transcriptional regulator with XRE-family HTH domain